MEIFIQDGLENEKCNEWNTLVEETIKPSGILSKSKGKKFTFKN